MFIGRLIIFQNNPYRNLSKTRPKIKSKANSFRIEEFVRDLTVILSSEKGVQSNSSNPCFNF